MPIGDKLKTARGRSGLTLQQVQDRTGIGQSSLSEFENDKREPRMSQLQTLADLYQRSITFFLAEEPAEEEVVLWRERPKSPAAEELTNMFLRLCEQYRNLENWCGEKRERDLPDAKVTSGTFGYPEAEELAHRVRKTWVLGDHPAKTLPGVLEEVCGIKVFHIAFEPTGVAASTVSPAFGPAMLINSNNVRWRRNFDVAHELFHLLTWNIFPKQKSAGTVIPREPEEKLATCFARHLLMPTEVLRDAVHRVMRKDKLAASSIVDLAREFDVSVQAMINHIGMEYRLPQAQTNRLHESCKNAVGAVEERISDTPPSRPERFYALALKALQRGEISIGRFAEYLGISRLHALRIAQQETVEDEEVTIPPP